MIETARLILRPWREADLSAMLAIGQSCAVQRFLGGRQSESEIREAFDRARLSQQDNGFCGWIMEDRERKAVIGTCGLMPYARFGTLIAGEIEIGWRLREEDWGQGYAREAAQACLDWAWVNLVLMRIVSLTVPANEASWRLMERLGMIRWPDLDFGHPAFAPDHPLHHHIVHVAERPVAG